MLFCDTITLKIKDINFKKKKEHIKSCRQVGKSWIFSKRTSCTSKKCSNLVKDKIAWMSRHLRLDCMFFLFTWHSDSAAQVDEKAAWNRIHTTLKYYDDFPNLEDNQDPNSLKSTPRHWCQDGEDYKEFTIRSVRLDFRAVLGFILFVCLFGVLLLGFFGFGFGFLVLFCFSLNMISAGIFQLHSSNQDLKASCQQILNSHCSLRR